MKNVHFVNKYLREPMHPVTVCLIGAGGTGSQVLQGLARMNAALKKLNHAGLMVYCFDDDVVTETNIGRQLFSDNDLGEYKANVLISRLNRFYGTFWEAIPQKFDKTNSDYFNITITCTDTVASRKHVSKHLIINSMTKNERSDWPNKIMYWFDCGNTKNMGQVWLSSYTKIEQPVLVGDSFNNVRLMDIFEAFGPQKETPNIPSCSMVQALENQDLYINTIVADMLCCLMWKLFREYYIEWNGAMLNLNNGVEAKTLPIRMINYHENLKLRNGELKPPTAENYNHNIKIVKKRNGSN